MCFLVNAEVRHSINAYLHLKWGVASPGGTVDTNARLELTSAQDCCWQWGKDHLRHWRPIVLTAESGLNDTARPTSLTATIHMVWHPGHKRIDSAQRSRLTGEGGTNWHLTLTPEHHRRVKGSCEVSMFVCSKGKKLAPLPIRDEPYVAVLAIAQAVHRR